LAPVQRRPSKSERTRESILTVAERLFSEKGFDATSLDAIGTEAGIQGTAILYHYPTKRELYEAVLDRIFMPLLEEMDAQLGAEAPLQDRLVAFTSVMVRFAAPGCREADPARLRRRQRRRQRDHGQRRRAPLEATPGCP
jgi:AcrR family transcriptional regulator